MDYAIAALGLLGAVIAVERALFFFRARTSTAALFAALENREAALRWVTEQRETPVMRLAKAALMNPRDVQGALDEAMLRESPRLEARTGYVAMLAKTVSLTGLLATVGSVQEGIRGFACLAPCCDGRGFAMKAALGDAMSSLLFAMVLSLVLLVSYALLVARAQALQAELQRTAVRLRRYLR